MVINVLHQLDLAQPLKELLFDSTLAAETFLEACELWGARRNRRAAPGAMNRRRPSESSRKSEALALVAGAGFEPATFGL